jgi:glycosyltransferase involved in cell wall biosynthesis
MASPRVSVVVPAYNAVHYLGETIDSIMAQTLTSWELVVVDDGSNDDTYLLAEEYARQDSRIRTVQQDNAGVASARNRGLAETLRSADYVAFLDADDVWLPDSLEVLVETADKFPRSVGAHGLGQFIDAASRIVRPGECEAMCRPRPTLLNGHVANSPVDAPTTFVSLIISGCIVAPGAVLIRRSVIERVQGFAPAFEICADWDMYIRLARYGDLRFLNRVVLSYRQHADNMSSQRRAQRSEQRRVLQRALTSSENSREQEQVARDAFVAAQRYFAREKIRLAVRSLMSGDLAETMFQTAYAIRHLGRQLTCSP